jgi:phage recombination protein Bet
MANEVAKTQEHSVTYEANGNEIKLTPNGIRKFIKKGNGNITDEEAINFMMLCKHNQLDPFVGEAYLVKFGDEAQMITSKEAFMKRAENHPKFKGFKAGIIVESDDDIKYRDGAFKLPKEKLVGAWCEVYRDDREIPARIEIGYEEFSKGQSTWKKQPANMIRKTAIVNGLREAFPNTLGAMYTEDDKSPQEVRREIQAEEKDETTESILEGFKKEEPKQIEAHEDTSDEAKELLEKAAKQTKEKVKAGATNDDNEGEQVELFEGATTNPHED